MGKFDKKKLEQAGLGHLWDDIRAAIYDDCREAVERRMVKLAKICMKDCNELSSPEGFIASIELGYVLNLNLKPLSEAVDMAMRAIENGPDRTLMLTIEETILDAYEKFGQEAAKRMAYVVSRAIKDDGTSKLGDTSFSVKYGDSLVEFDMNDSSTVEFCISIIDKAKTYGMKSWCEIVRIIAFNIEPEVDDLESCESSAIAPPDGSVSDLVNTAIKEEFSESGIVRAMRATMNKYHYTQHPSFKKMGQILYNGIDKMYDDDDEDAD